MTRGASPGDRLIGRELVIREAEQADIDAVAKLHAACFERPWSAAELETTLSVPGTRALVASAGSELVGFVVARSAGVEAEILSIAVCRDRRRSGLARDMLAGLDAHLDNHGVRDVFLEVDEANAAAIGLYHSCGFAGVGVRRGYYRSSDGARRDALVLHRRVDGAGAEREGADRDVGTNAGVT